MVMIESIRWDIILIAVLLVFAIYTVGYIDGWNA